MKKMTKHEIFTVPNIMSFFRLALIPVFCVMYLNAETTSDCLWAGAVVLLSSLTDLFDGMIARKLNQITDLGKVLDPVADKLSHAALAVCLAIRYPLMWALIALMAVKEGYMAIMGLKLLKNGLMLNGAMWFGKLCTASLFIGLLLLFLFPDIPLVWVNGIIIFLMGIMLITLCLYIPQFIKMRKGIIGEEVERLS